MDKAKYFIKSILEKIINFLIPSGLEPEERSKRVLTAWVVIATIPMTLMFSFIQFNKADYVLWGFLLFVTIVVSASLFIGRNIKKGINFYRFNMALLGLLFLYLIGTSGLHPRYALWAFIFPMEAFYLLGLREGGFFTSVFYIIAIGLIFSQDLIHGGIHYGFPFKRDFTFALLAVSLISYFFEKIKTDYELGMKQRQLLLEKERTELKETRDQLLNAGEKLESIVLERTKELTNANTQLRQEIEDRIHLERALRKSEEKYRLHFENVNDAIYTINKDLMVDTVSPSAMNVLGFREEELAGKSILDVEALAPEYQEKAISDIMRVLDGESIHASEYEFITKDGKRIFVETSGSPLIKNGEIIGLVSVARNITDRKAAERENARLEKKLREVQKMEAIGTLAGGIAHDFNNLLTGIQGCTSMMLLEIESSHPYFENLKSIEDYVNSATGLTKQLLGFARGGKYEVKPIDLNDLIKVSSQMFGRTKKEIKIHMKLQPDLWTVEVDKKQIEQVLLNLYINAWQATLEGGELYLQTENVRLSEDYAKIHQVTPGKYAKISVTDTGVGMDEATIQKIFDPFFTTKEMGRGTGLGLASVYGIIKNHGGIIDVYSEKYHGATFVIHLPASAKRVTREKDLSGKLLNGAETILLVDDEEMIIKIGKTMLEKLGYKVMIAKGGQEAIDLYRQTPDQIDIVILDMVMPDKSGGETYNRLKEVSPNVKVLLSSGYSADGQAKKILKRGCDGFIQKPFTIKALSQKVRDVLEKN